MKYLFSRIALLAVLGTFTNGAVADVLYSYVGAGPLTEQVSCTVLAIGEGAWVEGDDELPTDGTGQLCDEEFLANRPTMDTLKASFIVEDALTTDLSLSNVNVLSWSITDGTNTVTSENTDFGLNCLSYDCSLDSYSSCLVDDCETRGIHLSTDENGNITEWVFFASVDDATNLGLGDLTGIGSSFTTTEYIQGPTIVAPNSADDDWRDVYDQFDDPTSIAYSVDATYSLAEAGLPNTAFISTEAGTWTATVVPVPAAAWLFISALGLLGLRRKR